MLVFLWNKYLYTFVYLNQKFKLSLYSTCAVVEQLIETELKSSFTGQSDAIARKVKGFQEYLTGALQDLAHSAEQLELVVPPVIVKPSPLDENKKIASNDEELKDEKQAIVDYELPKKDITGFRKPEIFEKDDSGQPRDKR